MLKELSVKEALQLLAEKYPEPIKGYVKNQDRGFALTLKAVLLNEHFCFKMSDGNIYNNFYIGIPDEYRYMTQQECIDWVCLHGHKGYQVKYGNSSWSFPVEHSFSNPKNYQYRTIQEIDGKIIYGEPQEFKIKVEG